MGTVWNTPNLIAHVKPEDLAYKDFEEVNRRFDDYRTNSMLFN